MNTLANFNGKLGRFSTTLYSLEHWPGVGKICECIRLPVVSRGRNFSNYSISRDGNELSPNIHPEAWVAPNATVVGRILVFLLPALVDLLLVFIQEMLSSGPTLAYGLMLVYAEIVTLSRLARRLMYKMGRYYTRMLE